MAAEFSNNATQTVLANGGVIFSETPVPCNRGLIYHRDESPLFRLASPSAINFGCYRPSCGCCNMPTANYLVQFSGNIAIPEDPAGTVEAISLALAVDGEIDPSSIMTVTPAAVGDLWNVSTQIVVVVPWLCRCSSVSVRNVSTQPIEVSNANITFDFDGIRR